MLPVPWQMGHCACPRGRLHLVTRREHPTMQYFSLNEAQPSGPNNYNVAGQLGMSSLGTWFKLYSTPSAAHTTSVLRRQSSHASRSRPGRRMGARTINPGNGQLAARSANSTVMCLSLSDKALIDDVTFEYHGIQFAARFNSNATGYGPLCRNVTSWQKVKRYPSPASDRYPGMSFWSRGTNLSYPSRKHQSLMVLIAELATRPSTARSISLHLGCMTGVVCVLKYD
ncbi:hypothetical protein F5888DRAFT_1635654 [Russula emetica]|nr:hypothetical protein F5888DRAFT_1635654 [Russula emetica]